MLLYVELFYIPLMQFRLYSMCESIKFYLRLHKLGVIHLWGKNSIDNSDFYDELCNKYFKDVYEFCAHLVKDKNQFNDIIEECTQETFLEARKQINKLKKHPNVKGWLYITARNLVNKSFRKYYKKDKHEALFNEEIACASSTIEDELEKVLEDSINITALKEDVIKLLKKDEYELYIDYFVKKITIIEISKKYNISTTATTTRIYRLRKTIRKIVLSCYLNKTN